MTLNGVMAVVLHYFSKFGSFRGALHKSSRSLSHLLMTSCNSGSGSSTGHILRIQYWLEREKTLDCLVFRTVIRFPTIIMVALCNRADHYIFAL